MANKLSNVPPLDEQGAVKPHDHPQIADQDIMVRYLVEAWIVNNGEQERLSSISFKPPSKEKDPYRGVSIGHKKTVLCCYGSLKDWLPDHAVGLACIAASTLRLEENGKVGWTPREDDESHCSAWGLQSKASQKRIAKAATWKRRENINDQKQCVENSQEI